jgi:thiol-disulfide isomerase/thioredoxin
MKKLAFIVMAVAIVSCVQQRQGISVHIDGWGNDAVVVGYWNKFVDKVELDTLVARRGRFEVPVRDTVPIASISRVVNDGKVERPNSGAVQSLIFAMPPEGRMKVLGKQMDGYVEYSVEGSALNSEIAEYRDLMRDLAMESNRLYEAAKNTPDGLDIRSNEFAAFRESSEKLSTADLEFASEHPSSEWSVYILSRFYGIDEQFMKLTESAREGRFRPMYDRQMAEFAERNRPNEDKLTGGPAPDFTAVDQEGNKFTLSEYDTQGKYIVLDFWGSWCGPCIQGMPRMKQYYETHRNRLEIVGIACYDREDNWKKAVAENALPWVNVRDENPAADKFISEIYGDIKIFPTKVILSPDKQVLAIYGGEGNEFYDKLDELFKK